MSAKSTLRNLSGDRIDRWPIKWPYWSLYSIINRKNNRDPYSDLDPKLSIRDFSCDDVDDHWSQFSVSRSPARGLCNLFWAALPWGAVKEELGEIHILDCGCGKGEYGPRILQFSQNAVTSYTGLDVRPNKNWQVLENQYPMFKFHRCAEKDASKYMQPVMNFFMTQSAIEHFNEDLTFFRQIKDHVYACNTPVIQVHLFPSSECLRLFRLHGFRQYTPRTVSKITSIFSDCSYSVLYRLGGMNCNDLHYKFITLPEMIERTGNLREKMPEEYMRNLRSAVEADFTRRNESPAFYALIIHSNPMSKLF
jgi:hypothetical protein